MKFILGMASLALAILIMPSNAVAVSGTIGTGDEKNVCELAGGGQCYNPSSSLIWPTGTNTCDTWNASAGTCIDAGVSGKIGGTTQKAARRR